MYNRLPEIEYHPFDEADSPKNFNTEQYEEFLAEFRELIEADCHAITVDDEVLFNTYDNLKPIKVKIQEQMLRTYVTENAHSALFVNFFRDNRDRRVVIYMFENPWFHIIDYIAATKTFVTNTYASTAYRNRHM